MELGTLKKAARFAGRCRLSGQERRALVCRSVGVCKTRKRHSSGARPQAPRCVCVKRASATHPPRRTSRDFIVSANLKKSCIKPASIADYHESCPRRPGQRSTWRRGESA
jgi:hypothetical protein